MLLELVVRSRLWRSAVSGGISPEYITDRRDRQMSHVLWEYKLCSFTCDMV